MYFFRYIYVLTNTGDIIIFDLWDSRAVGDQAAATADEEASLGSAVGPRASGTSRPSSSRRD